MGNSESVQNAHEYRLHNTPIKLPMPDQKELNTRFDKVLGSMNLSADKVKVLSEYDNDKKWELICDQDAYPEHIMVSRALNYSSCDIDFLASRNNFSKNMSLGGVLSVLEKLLKVSGGSKEKVLVKNPPIYYIQMLRSYLHSSVKSKTFKRRIANSTHTLRELEISLRTNHIGWVREFLNEENRGLDVLVEYLSFAHLAFKYGDVSFPATNLLSSSRNSGSAGDLSIGYVSLPSIDKRSSVASTISRRRNRSFPNKRTLKNSRTVVERDDVHVCITCLRTIMNYQYGFNLVMEHRDCINEVALGLNHKTSRTKVLVLELLAAVCLVRGGHDIILQAFNNFKVACNESRRFSKLMQYFKFETENIDFMVMCMQFINIVVHSVEDMNFRVHLQYEFTMLGLDEYLETLRETESDRLKIQIQAYLDNMFDVSSLLEDSEVKLTALERIEKLEDQLLSLNEKIQEQEYENMTTIVELEKQLSAKDREIVDIKDSPSSTADLTSFQVPSPKLFANGDPVPGDGRYSNTDKSNWNPELVVPVRLVQASDGVGWMSSSCDSTMDASNTERSLRNNQLEEMAQRGMVLIPSEVWQDLEKMKFHIPNSPSVSSFHSGSTSGSSGFTTDTSFQYIKNTQSQDSTLRIFRAKTLSSPALSQAANSLTSTVKDQQRSSSLPRKPGLHRFPRFYMDGEDYIDFDDSVSQNGIVCHNHQSDKERTMLEELDNADHLSTGFLPNSKNQLNGIDDGDSLEASGFNSSQGNNMKYKYDGRKSKGLRKSGFSKKEYAVLPGISEKSYFHFNDSEILSQPLLHHKLSSLGSEAPEIPLDVINSNYLEDLPPPPDNLLFNKNPVLPALKTSTEDYTANSASTDVPPYELNSVIKGLSCSSDVMNAEAPAVTPIELKQQYRNADDSSLTIIYEECHVAHENVSKQRPSVDDESVVQTRILTNDGTTSKSRQASTGNKDGLDLRVKTKDHLSALNRKSNTPSPPAPSINSKSTPVIDLPPPPPPPPPPPAPGVPAPPPPPPPPPPLGMPNLPGATRLPVGLRAKQRHQTKYRLPALNWKALKPNQVEGTVFNDLDDEAILEELDMDEFEETFKTKAQDSEADKLRLRKLAEAQEKRGTSLIDMNRARNLSITLRKIGLSTDEICRSVYGYNLEALPLEYVEMLPKFIPNETELKAFKQYEKEGKSFDRLASEDKFMWLFGRVERLQQRLTIMIFIGNFNETVRTLTPQLAAIIAASMSIKSSQKLKKVLEVILAFGNYMNSSKRGAVYGFKLQSLDSLLDTKSTDKKQSLLHYIVSVIQTYYPDAQDFYQELRYVDRATKVSLDNIISDVTRIRKDMELTTREHETHHHPVLNEFLQMAEPKVHKLYSDSSTAQEAYKAVVEYFGESTKSMPPETFFPMVDRFLKSYQKAENDIGEWKKQEAKRAIKKNQQKKQKALLAKQNENANNNAKLQQQQQQEEENVIKELRAKQRKDRRAVESKDGLIEDNIHYIKSEPYRRADAVNRSLKRRNRPEMTRNPISTML